MLCKLATRWKNDMPSLFMERLLPNKKYGKSVWKKASGGWYLRSVQIPKHCGKSNMELLFLLHRK